MWGQTPDFTLTLQVKETLCQLLIHRGRFHTLTLHPQGSQVTPWLHQLFKGLQGRPFALEQVELCLKEEFGEGHNQMEMVQDLLKQFEAALA